jgi:hypothetical protein
VDYSSGLLAQRDYYGSRYPELGGNSALLIFIPGRSPADTRPVEQSDRNLSYAGEGSTPLVSVIAKVT